MCEHTPAEVETNSTEEDLCERVEQTPWDCGDTCMHEIHVGSLYYREFPFGGYCEEAPVAESHFSQERKRVCARADTRVRYLTSCLSTRETRPV